MPSPLVHALAGAAPYAALAPREAAIRPPGLGLVIWRWYRAPAGQPLVGVR